MQDEPYFLTNEEWYTVSDFDEDGRGYHLTDVAPQKAIDSYNEFYGEPAYTDDKGNNLIPDKYKYCG